MIDIKEANVGDFVYVKASMQEAPVFGEIVKVLETENAVQVLTAGWGHRIIIAENAYWEEKTARKSKRFKVANNYKQWIKEMLTNEETETDNRIDTIHHGQSEVCEDQRETTGSDGFQKSVKRKQKAVRKPAKKKRKASRNRKISTSKK